MTVDGLHIAALELKRRMPEKDAPHLVPERREPRVVIRQGHTGWERMPPTWRLEGRWPSEAAEIGGPPVVDCPARWCRNCWGVVCKSEREDDGRSFGWWSVGHGSTVHAVSAGPWSACHSVRFPERSIFHLDPLEVARLTHPEATRAEARR